MPKDTRLQAIMRLLYQMQPEDTARLETELLSQAKQAWRTALREKAQQYTGRRLAPRDPSGEDLDYLKELARSSAASIARTYNKQAANQIARLFTANRRGNRNYYRKHMEEWAARRASWHSPATAAHIVQTTREYAKDRFREMNGIRPRGFVLAGPPPVCPVCIEAQGAGVVDLAYTRRVPMPAHFRCQHEWEEVSAGRRLKPSELWLG